MRVYMTTVPGVILEEPEGGEHACSWWENNRLKVVDLIQSPPLSEGIQTR